MDDIQAKIDQAKKAGYSDDDIAEHLSSVPGYADKIKTAKDSGYSSSDIVSHLSGAESQPKAAAPAAPAEDKGYLERVGDNLSNEALGALRGAGSIGATLLYPYDKAVDLIKGDRNQSLSDLVSGKAPLSRNEQRRARMDKGFESVGADTGSGFFKFGKTMGEFAGTAGTGAAISAPIKGLPLLAPLAESIAGAGLSAPGVAGTGLAAAAKSGALRTVGGGIAGGVGAGLIDPSQAETGLAIGAGLPSAFKVLGSAGSSIANLAAPFSATGQKYTIGRMLNDFSHNPEAALSALKSAPDAYPSGALPTTAESAGDIGLASLTRGMANTQSFGNNLTARLSEQNAQRTEMISDVAGSSGKMDAAKVARDAATADLREKSLNEAGHIDASPITSKIDALLSNPDNAGKLSQQALNQYKSQLSKFVNDDGRISARAVYAIRKDINDALDGKFQGDEGNLRHASSQLIAVKKIFDNAIEGSLNKSSDKVLAVRPQTGNSLVDLAYQGSQKTEAPATNSFKEYLKTYSDMSKPIDQMDALQKIFKRIQNGTEDTGGNLILSASQLNKILKNEGDDLSKMLSDDQMQVLRNLSAELNASSKGMTAGTAIRSNSIQNYNTDKAIKSMLGDIGLSTVGNTVLGGLSRLAMIRANEDLMQQLGETLLDPKRAAKLMEEAQKTNMTAEKLADFVKSSSGSSVAELSAQGKK